MRLGRGIIIIHITCHVNGANLDGFHHIEIETRGLFQGLTEKISREGEKKRKYKGKGNPK